MAISKIVSKNFPFITIVVTVRKRVEKVEALIDTGFEGDVVVPKGLLTNGDPPDTLLPWQLANETVVLAPVYAGRIKLGNIASFTVSVVTLGNEVMIGRGVTDRFKVIFDHGRKVIIEE